jgi:DNA-binding transcriptional MerR regulator
MASGIRKLYYSIREVSDMTGLKPHVLRYWESEFPALQPKKNRAGNRAYTEPDIELVRRIQHLVHEEKYTLEGARQVLERDAEGDGVPRAALGEMPRDQLEDLRAFLADVLRRL